MSLNVLGREFFFFSGPPWLHLVISGTLGALLLIHMRQPRWWWAAATPEVAPRQHGPFVPYWVLSSAAGFGFQCWRLFLNPIFNAANRMWRRARTPQVDTSQILGPSHYFPMVGLRRGTTVPSLRRVPIRAWVAGGCRGVRRAAAPADGDGGRAAAQRAAALLPLGGGDDGRRPAQRHRRPGAAQSLGGAQCLPPPWPWSNDWLLGRSFRRPRGIFPRSLQLPPPHILSRRREQERRAMQACIATKTQPGCKVRCGFAGAEWGSDRGGVGTPGNQKIDVN